LPVRVRLPSAKSISSSGPTFSAIRSLARIVTVPSGRCMGRPGVAADSADPAIPVANNGVGRACCCPWAQALPAEMLGRTRRDTPYRHSNIARLVASNTR
jgi:hypothetical protein